MIMSRTDERRSRMIRRNLCSVQWRARRENVAQSQRYSLCVCSIVIHNCFRVLNECMNKVVISGFHGIASAAVIRRGKMHGRGILRQLDHGYI